MGDLAKKITYSQMRASQTLSTSGGRLDDDLYSANLFMLSLLLDNKPISVDTIESINKLVNYNALSDSFPKFAGVMRGTVKTINLTDKKITINAKERQIALGWMKWHFIHYLPANEVPAKINALIERINRIDKGTSLIDVLKIARKLIVIHPFLDGNGRTTRVLVDYMLMKTGLPPVPHQKGLTNLFLFENIEKIEEHYLKAYRSEELLRRWSDLFKKKEKRESK